MPETPHEIARRRVMELADDPTYRPFVVGYLLSCLPERHWEALVQSALEFVEGVDRHRAELAQRFTEVRKERG